MQDEQPRKKQRIPLSAEELYYFKKSKQLNELKKIQEFKASFFYKFFNYFNIFSASLLSYCILSILICCQWQTAYIGEIHCSYDSYNSDTKRLSICKLEITTKAGEMIDVNTTQLFEKPQLNEMFFVGKDFLFGKIIKIKLANSSQSYWHIYTYPSITVCVFALLMGFFVYKINKHLSINGLLFVSILFTLANLYFILI
jgi:hypothetical protein